MINEMSDTTTMDLEEENIYEDPEALTKRFKTRQQTRNNNYAGAKSNLVASKKNDKVTFNNSIEKVTLNRDMDEISEIINRQFNATKSVHPVNGGGHLAPPRTPQISYLGASMPNLSDQTETKRRNKKRRTDHVHEIPPRENNSKDVSCNCCCFFLLYMLLAAVLVVFFIYLYHPEYLNLIFGLDLKRQDGNREMKNVKKEFQYLKKFLKSVCEDYMDVTNPKFPKFQEECESKYRGNVKGGMDDPGSDTD